MTRRRPPLINNRLILFQLCGLCPYSPITVLTIALIVWTSVNLTFVVVLLVKVTGSANLLFLDPERTDGQLNPILLIKSSFTIAAHVLVLAETLIQHVTFARVAERLESTARFLSMGTAPKTDRSQRKLLFYLLICATSEVGNFWTAQPLYRTAWYTTVASQCVIRLKHLQHMQYVEGLSIRFQVLKKQLQQFVAAAKDEEKARYSGGKFASHAKQWQHSIDKRLQLADCLQKVFIIKSTYLALWETGQLLAGAFTVSQLANLLQNFVQCTCDLYTIYSHLYRNHFEDIFGKI